uniref:Thymidylate synthase n=1 Tax=Candidatus Kentrum sp. TUN TaxID=2126343 RepID=A0A451AEN4_9GAMM|nr:MAG: thymidylate synthase [Candidatus Kentron sp. TUN]VFK64485.1 MAG: thymidylate synthase [Candidatus Kentron sp. TUN]VFK65902.1 MAG: thymidylate synthase [Candidatus Kentron sp. TUN]
MNFEPLYYRDRLRIVNPAGDVGIVTLWSRVEQAFKALGELNIDTNALSSRISVVANLYGNGLPQMLRNLLWNPQINHLLVLGQDLSGSRQELINFFNAGIEPVIFQDVPAFRIKGTDRIIDGNVTPENFSRRINITSLGKFAESTTRKNILTFFDNLPPKQENTEEREDIAIPAVEITRFPAEPRSQTILRSTPIEAWKELIFRLVRFGHRNTLRKGERYELQNVKVIIEKPEEESEKALEQIGFSLGKFKQYQKQILDPIKPDDLEYSYGNRMCDYFTHNNRTVNLLEVAVQRLLDDPESRHAYISLWDPARDISEKHGHPCFVSLYFRKFDNKLTTTATFRTHNAFTAWLENVYGLMAIQSFVAARVNMECGAITIFSHSISVSEESIGQAKVIADAKYTDNTINQQTGKPEPRYDHNGNFAVTIDWDTGEIVVHHIYQGVTLTEYRARRAEELETGIARDCTISEISHALYLGREIARKEAVLKAGR